MNLPLPKPNFWESPAGLTCQLLRDLAIRQEDFVNNKTIDQALMAYDLSRLIYLRHVKGV